MMPKTVRLAITIIVLHSVTGGLYHFASLNLDILPSSIAQEAFVIIYIAILPFVAGFLLWLRCYTAGGAFLFGAMAGALIFGIYHHPASGAEYLFSVPDSGWCFIFQLTVSLLLILEGVGCWVAFKVLELDIPVIKIDETVNQVK